VPAAGGEQRLDGVVAEIRARGHRVRERRHPVTRLEVRGCVGTRRRADVPAFRVEDDEEPDRARVVAHCLERPHSVRPSASKNADCGFTATTYGATASAIPVQKRDRGCGSCSPEHGLAPQLHRHDVEARIEADDELRALALDRLYEPVAEVAALLHPDEA
jgi:hypothetical protein